MQANEASTEVIIVGAGPVGLFAVFQLGLAKLKAQAQAAHRYVHPDKRLRFQYTTSSSELQRLLKVA